MKTLSKYMYAEKDGSKKVNNFNEPRCQIDNEAQDVKDGMKNRLKMQESYDVWLDENRDDLHRTIPYWGKTNEAWNRYMSEGNKQKRAEDMFEAVLRFRETYATLTVQEVTDDGMHSVAVEIDEYEELDNLTNRYKKGPVNEAKRAEMKRRIEMEERRISEEA